MGEAAFNLAASLERFLEFTVHVLSLHHGISTDEFRATWKDVARQSERQLGMFLCMWLIHTRQAPKLIGGDWVKFRNDVVHAGLIPSETDVTTYGEEVLAFVSKRLDVLKTDARQAIEDRTMARAIDALDEVKNLRGRAHDNP